MNGFCCSTAVFGLSSLRFRRTSAGIPAKRRLGLYTMSTLVLSCKQSPPPRNFLSPPSFFSHWLMVSPQISHSVRLSALGCSVVQKRLRRIDNSNTATLQHCASLSAPRTQLVPFASLLSFLVQLVSEFEDFAAERNNHTTCLLLKNGECVGGTRLKSKSSSFASCLIYLPTGENPDGITPGIIVP